MSPTASVTTSNNLNGDLYVAQFDAHDGAGAKVCVWCTHVHAVLVLETFNGLILRVVACNHTRHVHTTERSTDSPCPSCSLTHLQQQVTAHGTSGRYTAQDLSIDADGAIYLAGKYQGNSLALASDAVLPSPGFVTNPPDGFLGRVWLVRAY